MEAHVEKGRFRFFASWTERKKTPHDHPLDFSYVDRPPLSCEKVDLLSEAGIIFFSLQPRAVNIKPRVNVNMHERKHVFHTKLQVLGLLNKPTNPVVLRVVVSLSCCNVNRCKTLPR